MFEIVIFWISVAFVLIGLVALAVIYFRLYSKLTRVEIRMGKIKDYATSVSHKLHILYNNLDEDRCSEYDIMRTYEAINHVNAILEELCDNEFET